MRRRKRGDLTRQLRPLIGERRIRARVKQLARRISWDYRGTVPVFLGILNGSFIFLADLVREVRLDCEVDFVRLSSYHGRQSSSGRVDVLGVPSSRLKGRDVIVVEDVVDSGRTMKCVRRIAERAKPKSLRSVALLHKNCVGHAGDQPDYVGFVIPADFVAGYGLDDNLQKRNLKAVYRLRNSARVNGVV